VTPTLFCLVRAELGDTFVPCSFAMWTAFPPSDYCEGSVTIGFSTSRPSRLYAHETFGARRCPFVSLPELIVPYPSKRALAHLTPISEYFNGVASGMLRRGYRCPVGNLGSSGRLTIRTGLAEHHPHPFNDLRFLAMLVSPLSFLARSGSVLEVVCSQPLLSVKGISCASKRRTRSAYPILLFVR
jgi:hypothetical protein